MFGPEPVREGSAVGWTCWYCERTCASRALSSWIVRCWSTAEKSFSFEIPKVLTASGAGLPGLACSGGVAEAGSSGGAPVCDDARSAASASAAMSEGESVPPETRVPDIGCPGPPSGWLETASAGGRVIDWPVWPASAASRSAA